MPPSDVTVTAVFSSLYHKIYGNSCEGGYFTVQSANMRQVSDSDHLFSAPAGDLVNLYFFENEGYWLNDYTVTDEEGEPLDLIYLDYGVMFTMPETDVYITTEFTPLHTVKIRTRGDGVLTTVDWNNEPTSFLESPER